jgi:hypothetical protein
MSTKPCQICGAALGRGDAVCSYCQSPNPRFEEDRREEAEQESLALRKRRQVRLGLALGVAAIAVIFAVSALLGQGDLKRDLAEVERAHAQVKNVIERQEAVEVRYRDAPQGPDRDAELSGAENRVRIERARYDKVAAQYNADAGAGLGGLWTRLFGMPARVPLSNEVKVW